MFYNKMTLQIIYTPESDNYRLGDFETGISHRPPRDPLLQQLRVNYQRLRQSIPNIPEQVGVVTYPDVFKRDSRKLQEEIENSSSTYQPLELLDRALKLRSEDLTNPIAREYVDRSLSVIIQHPALCMSPSIRERRRFFSLSALASSQMVLSKIKELEQQTREKTPDNPLLVTLGDLLKVIPETYADFREVENMHKYLLERFDANKVSRSFPLYFLPEDYSPSSLFSVSLAEGIETPDFVEGLLKYIKVGCEVSGYKGIPENIQREIDSWSRDKFGETKRVNSMDELLSSLPEPKTIITDTYIVNGFPQLVGLDFESHEFR